LTRVRRLGVLTAVAAIAMATLVVGLGVRGTAALFSDQETITASEATAGCFVNDAAAPTISASIVSKTTPYYGGFIKQGAAYYVYANISGAATRVTADVRPLTGGQYLAPLTAGSYSVGGVAYGWRTASLTAGSPLAEGAYTYSISAANAALQCRTASSTVTIDHTAPVPTDVDAGNGGVRAVEPDPGDSVIYTFSEPIDPETISSGWTGTARNVVVRIQDIGSADDTLTIWNSTNTVQLPLGQVDLNANFAVTNTTFGASGTPSTMVASGNTITVTLGTLSSGEGRKGAKAEMVWTPSAGPTDAAGNASTTPIVTEGALSDADF